MMAGNAAMVVALADSLFLSISPDVARGRVLAFLAVSFVPFLVLAPLIGPVIDRMVGGRRLVVQAVALARVVLCIVMAGHIDDLLLFPLAFASLVLQKAYELSKAALVPAVVRSNDELVEANSKLGLIAGLIGVLAVLPAGLLQATAGAGAALPFAAMLFLAGFVVATRLPREPIAEAPPSSRERHELAAPGPLLAATALAALRAGVGFLFFHLAFALRKDDAGTLWFGVALLGSALGTMLGNTVAPAARRALSEERMLAVVLAGSAAVGVLTTVLGGPAAAVVFATAVNLAGALGRLAFEAIVQRDAPGANHGRAFARFETRFQLVWVLGGLVAVALLVPMGLGLGVVTLLLAATLAFFLTQERHLAAGRGGSVRPARRAAPARGPVRRPRQG
jgi:hypothetical protein